MNNKLLLIFAMYMGIIVSTLVADNRDNKNNPMSSSGGRANDIGDNVITPTYDSKGNVLDCHGYVYEIVTETGEILYEVFEEMQEERPGYTLYNEIYGQKVECIYEEGSICHGCKCGVLITP